MSGMKRCPNCSTEYDDNIRFCTKDGRALVTTNTSRARLCPHCANSIEENAVKCPYCKAEFRSTEERPQWPSRDEMAGQPDRNRQPASRAWTKRAMATLGASSIVVLALGLFSIAGYRQRNDARQLKEANPKQAHEREEKIMTLEGELKQLRQELDKSKKELTSLAAKLEENQKELSATQQRLTTATREAARVAAKRPAIAPGSSARSVKTPPSPQAAPVRRSAEPGVYEVVRATTVREEPSTTARRVTEINKGTKITVVRTVGNWLEVRSKQGRPPGYVRLDDAILVTRTN